MSIHFKNDWETPLQGEFQKDYYRRLHQFLLREYRTQTVYPNMYDIFNAFHYTAY
ncbi:Uracil-DNA glycosylase family protein [Pseudoramibacter alactolyticus ATCC 23263]|uniref:Uracil-DNA glycosylase family protein n=2 Tax=Pseudoramibacter TaxID=113286 RepID=E6MH48_9FIRM|nr:Uracil-DNA glycosylase family protein [Pseudoramibacter alactolyticus ATCC 23263]